MGKVFKFITGGFADLFDFSLIEYRPINRKQYLINTCKYLRYGFESAQAQAEANRKSTQLEFDSIGRVEKTDSGKYKSTDT